MKNDLNEFKAFNGLLERFKSMHKLKLKSISGEIKSDDHRKIQEIFNKLKKKNDKLTRRTFRIVMRMHFFIEINIKNFFDKNDDYQVFKKKNDRVTKLFCFSMKGEEYKS